MRTRLGRRLLLDDLEELRVEVQDLQVRESERVERQREALMRAPAARDEGEERTENDTNDTVKLMRATKSPLRSLRMRSGMTGSGDQNASTRTKATPLRQKTMRGAQT